ncbi:MAG: hypothetical protein R3B74_08755 [Nitrospirales bacterium]|nr:hypothetical protein [Nitrospirales bacterium]
MSKNIKENGQGPGTTPRPFPKKIMKRVKGMANIVRPLRSVIHKTPDDYGMTGWKDLVIPSDGIPLEAWYIPAKAGPSDKLVIFNHALPMCRRGLSGTSG